MQHTMPRFKYRFANYANNHVACIEVDKKVIHHIHNLDEFYRTFGYTQEVRKTGLLPDEFIWAEYIQDSQKDFSACLQMHIIEYLRKHSPAFQEEYGQQSDAWLAAHAEVRARRGAACAACRLKPFCEK